MCMYGKGAEGQGRSSSVFLCLRSVQGAVTLMNMCGDITEGMALRTTSFHLAYPINQSDKQIKRESGVAQARCCTPKWRNNIITLPVGSWVGAPSAAGFGQATLVFQDNFWFHFRGTARRVLVMLPDLRLNIQILLGKLVIVPFRLQTWKPASKQGLRSLPDFLQPSPGPNTERHMEGFPALNQ